LFDALSKIGTSFACAIWLEAVELDKTFLNSSPERIFCLMVNHWVLLGLLASRI
jgi:hypothetical protein